MSPGANSKELQLNRSKADPIVLASLSPRRREILALLGIEFETATPDFKEVAPVSMPNLAIPVHFAEQKALSVSRLLPGRIVLGSDTVVVIDDAILGKPSDSEDALGMLNRLAGRVHEVISGVALAREGRILESGREITRVKFASVASRELEAYARSGEPMDKAGAYAIQGRGARLVERIEGCYYNVVGLPVQLVLGILARHAGSN